MKGVVKLGDNPSANTPITIRYSNNGSGVAAIQTDSNGNFEYTPAIVTGYTIVVPDADPYLAMPDEENIVITRRVVTSANNVTDGPQSDLVQPEPIFERSGYFCGTNTTIWVGNKELEVSFIQWTINQDRSPLYSHAATYYNAMMDGQYLVSGGMVMPLRSAYGLRKYIQTYNDDVLDNSPFDMEFRLQLDKNYRAQKYILTQVYLSAASHGINPDGQPAVENYEFIARKLIPSPKQ